MKLGNAGAKCDTLSFFFTSCGFSMATLWGGQRKGTLRESKSMDDNPIQLLTCFFTRASWTLKFTHTLQLTSDTQTAKQQVDECF